jgi:glycosyltransferase involved in cell wall biosynthesis
MRARVLLSKRLIADSFDAEFYRNSSADLQSAGVDFLDHYLLFGWKENRDPAPWFSTPYYRAAYPRMELYDIDPLTHYLIWGKGQGFKTHPNLPPALKPQPLRAISCINDTMLLDASIFKPGKSPDPVLNYDSGKMDVHWVIPNFGIGGGGHMTIFRMVHWLEYLGHKCTIWISTKDSLNPDARYDDILKYYQFIKAEIRTVSPALHAIQGDALIATSWDTAALVNSAKGFKERFYFVQDYEPMFYARGSRGVLAEGTYELDLACICASPWLRHMMETKHGRWAREFNLSYDPDFYYAPAVPERNNPTPRIAVYSRIGTERRCVELALLALEHLARQGVNFHVDIFGVDQPFKDLTFSSTFHGVLSAEELGALYRNCDLGLCFSATNYSLVPQEMMACGLPVIELDVESARHSIGKDAAYFTQPLPEKIAESIMHLLAHPEERRALAERGREWAASTSWESAALSVEAALKERLSERGWTAIKPAAPPVIQQEPVKASIIIPTFNGGRIFDELLVRIGAQKAGWPFELVIIDSGSSDDTVAKARKLSFAKVVEIPKKEFQHGRTRNFGVTQSSGEYVLFLTQDALPADSFWLYNFVSTMEKFPEAAGGFGKHFAHQDASILTKMELRNHFAGFNQFPLMVSKYTDIAKWNSRDRGWRQFLHFYSDNNSCMRRNAWDLLPYPEISYGEDQLWAGSALGSAGSSARLEQSLLPKRDCSAFS